MTVYEPDEPQSRPGYADAKAALSDSSRSPSAALRSLATLVDGAADARDEPDLQLAVEHANRLDAGDLTIEQRARLHYFLSDAWAQLDALRFNERASWARRELEREIIHLRIAARLADAGKASVPLRCHIVTNLGNALEVCGRHVEAIASYGEALSLDPTFGMARGNRGVSLVAYAQLTHEPVHQCLLAREGHTEIVRALGGRNLTRHARQSFAETRTRVERHLSREYLEAAPHEHPERLGRSKREREYRQWCLAEHLVLNPLNELGPRPVGARDSLTLPAITTAIGRGPQYHGFFNQLKQEYVTARYLAYEGIHTDRPHFSDSHVDLTELYDYAAYGIGVEKIKIAYRMAYSIFDKTAVFLNAYCRVGLLSKKVEFRSIWYENGTTRAPLREALHRPHNDGLRALFWLSRDLFDRKTPYAEATEPEAAEAAEIRSHLEHKYLKLHTEFAGPPRPPVDDGTESTINDDPSDDLRLDRLAFSMSRSDFTRRTRWALRTARAALLYTVFAVRIEEYARESAKTHSGAVLENLLRSVDDRYKV